MRDNQRRKVYNWENSKHNSAEWCDKGKQTTLTKQQCIHIVNQLNKVFGCMGRVKFVNRDQNALGNSNGLITLPTCWAMNWNVILHEYAHVLTYTKYNWNNTEGHGKEFVTTYCTFLKNFHPAKPTYKELAKSLNERNIDFISFDNDLEKKAKRRKVSLDNFKEDKSFDELTTTRVSVTPDGIRRYYIRKTRIDKICFVIQAIKQSEYARTLPLEKVLHVFKRGFIPFWEGKCRNSYLTKNLNSHVRPILNSMPKVTLADLKYIDKHKRGIKLITPKL